ncbi:heat shock 70 kDa protein 12A-like isoform X2 [Mya arenaria]|uniref:heat shock 70 kDa protein 12A-like isoform X1 n=1 Tax=Mya arenaria TaxID=6604 RepID=UPI0022DFF6CE|nr:heat shock 70 kDa protein 12A-like isoform X1 [Mya arenaria]XP_052788876.1 heat shock 70 kDa protein 12A-like isoform X2 [Mya arenaria]
MASGSALVVAAIDFGTTYSGWAFSFKHEFERDPTKVSAKTWRGGQLSSLKGPTCVLIKPDGKTLETFGFEAEKRYTELAEEDAHKKWFYFRRFKMSLWNKVINRNTKLEDESGKELPAMTVFSLSIRFLKDELLKTSGDQIGGNGLEPEDIHWVLTVPAIWNDAAKQFMREAAQEAGMLQNMLTIALEPEAASLYCRHLPVEKGDNSRTCLSKFSAGKKYLVLDAGGGTVDITVHEVGPSGDLKELHKASGGAWGGTKVDEAFMNFLGQLAGPDVIERFKDVNMEDYIDLLRDFEIKKRDIAPSKDSKVTIKLPIALSELVREMKGTELKSKIQQSGLGEKAKLTGDKLRLEASVVKTFFQTSISSCVKHVSDLLDEPVNRGVQAILMVGGFSESPMLQEMIKTKFPKLTIITPPEAGLAVLKGAVIFGHSPKSISERVSKYTYGTDITVPFDESQHPWSKRKEYKNGEVRCTDIFSKLVELGQTMVVGQPQDAQNFTPVTEDQKSMPMNIYAAKIKDPKFVTDYGCQQIGSFDVPMTGTGTDRSVMVRMTFAGTEIDVECKQKDTSNVTHLKVDFLS